MAGMALSCGSVGITFTYRPVIWCSISSMQRRFSVKWTKVVLSQRLYKPRALDDMLHCVDALNIDVKAFD